VGQNHRVQESPNPAWFTLLTPDECANLAQLDNCPQIRSGFMKLSSILSRSLDGPDILPLFDNIGSDLWTTESRQSLTIGDTSPSQKRKLPIRAVSACITTGYTPREKMRQHCFKQRVSQILAPDCVTCLLFGTKKIMNYHDKAREISAYLRTIYTDTLLRAVDSPQFIPRS